MLTLVIAAICWGMWWNTQRADRKWRFEYYTLDFAIGALLMAVAMAMTLGNSGASNTFTFEDNMTVGSKRNMATAFAGGVIFCLGNVMTLAGAVVAGMSTALPVAAAMALLVAVAMAGGVSEPALAYGGMGVAVAAVLAAAMGQKEAAAASPVKKGVHPGWKGFILSAVGGLIGGAGVPVAEMSRGGDIGLGAYGTVVFMMAGMVAMSPLMILYFLNLPVQGQAGPLLGYLKGTKGQHGLGLAGGAIFGIGTMALFCGAGSIFPGAPKFLSLQAGVHAGAVAGAVCGLMVWKEQAGAPKAKLMLLGSMGLLAGAVAMIFLGA